MKCTYTKTNGERCGANAMKKSNYCFAHNPDTKEDHSLAVVKGGKSSKRDRLSLPERDVKTPSDVVEILEETINGVRNGSIPPNVANTIAYICSHTLKAMETANLDGRIEMIESILMQRKTVKRK